MADQQRILLVEADAASRRLLSDILVIEGYAVDAAHDIGDARQLLSKHEYALVIADAQLPSDLVIDAAIRLGTKTNVMSDYVFRHRLSVTDDGDRMIRPIRPSELLAGVERHIGKPFRSLLDT